MMQIEKGYWIIDKKLRHVARFKKYGMWKSFSETLFKQIKKYLNKWSLSFVVRRCDGSKNFNSHQKM